MSDHIQPRMVIRHPGAANVVKRLCDDLGISESINRYVPGDPDAWKISPGEHFVTLIINVLTTQKPLYRVAEDLRQRDVAALYGPTVTADDFNDHALGRMLERAAQADFGQLFSAVSLRAALKEGIDISRLHADTTTLSVHGLYEEPGEPANISFGYSTDKRPDLKQLLFGLMVSQEGYPAAADVRDGNLTPKEWQLTGIEIAAALAGHLSHDWIYVADSALVTRTHLKEIQERQMKFISRIPDNFGLPDKLREKAWEQDNWTDLGRLSDDKDGARYKVCSLTDFIDGEKYRFLVVQSSRLDERKERKLKNQIEKERKDMEKAIKELVKEAFSCQPDAEKALAKFQSEWSNRLNRPELYVVEKTKLKRGRPPKNRPAPTKTYYMIEGEVQSPSDELLTDLRQKQSCFVLITNILDEVELSNREMLLEYKAQGRVEQRFRFLKDPVFIDSVYLKNQDRVYALGFVFLFAMLIASLMELKVRRKLKARQEIITVPGGRRTDRPTIRAILDLLNTFQVSLIFTSHRVQRIHTADIEARILKLLELLEYDISIYVDP